ncbi:MAG: YggT family protein [Treponema sp.]|nr:YggT family protein [Treponema sp.]
MMKIIFNFIATAAGIYSFLLIIRIILTWFGGTVTGRPVDILCRITDPYLNWWRAALNLRIGALDLSPVAAFAGLSLVQNLCINLAYYGRLTIGVILSVAVRGVWSVASFFLGLCIIILILRIIAYLTNRDVYGSFWKVIDSVSQPLLYKTNRIIFGSRITGYLKGIIVSTLALGVIYIGGGYVIRFVAKFLAGLPL